MDGIFQSNRLIDNKRYDDDDNDNLLKCAKTQIGIKQTHMTIDSSSKTTITIQHVIMMMMVNVTKSWYYSKIIYYLVLEQKFKKKTRPPDIRMMKIVMSCMNVILKEIKSFFSIDL